MKISFTKRILVIGSIFFGLISPVTLKANEGVPITDIKNWFRNEYWMYEKYSEAFCGSIQNLKNPSENLIELCSKKSAAVEQTDSDWHRKGQCDLLIKTKFDVIKKNKLKEKIIDDCKRIYNTYKDDSEFLEDTEFTSLWEGFLLGKELPFYEGNYGKDLKKEGFGKYYYANGAIYIGEWLDDEWHGKGTVKLASGGSFSADFVNGKLNGKGNYYYSNGDTYSGDFVNNKMEGEGTFKFMKSGGIYKGEWKNDKQNGFGTYTFKNGSKWVGIFHEGERVNGIKYDEEGKILEQGIWKNNEFFKSEKVNLKSLKSSNNSIQEKDINHDICLKAADYKGCMKYQNR